MENTPITNQLKQAISSWETIVDKLPQATGVSGGSVTTTDITDSLIRLADIIEESETGQPDPILKAVHWQGVISQVGNLTSTLQTIVNSGPTPNIFAQHAQNIINVIWGLRSTLLWLRPITASSATLESPSLQALAANANKILELRKEAGKASSDLITLVADTTKTSERATALLTDIQGHERTAANAKSSAEADATTAKQTASTLESILTKQSAESEAMEALLKVFEQKRELVETTLQGASKMALANSFQTRRLALNKERWGWVAGFVIGILLLTGAGISVVPRVLADASKSTAPNYWEMLSHILIIGPLVWATWFAARKAGQTMRLAEDYAFKEAAAHSFVGYKQEMADDDAMLHELRQYAVRNFGADPLRVLDSDEAASPAHEIVTKLLNKVDKLKPEEAFKALSDLAKALGQSSGAK